MSRKNISIMLDNRDEKTPMDYYQEYMRNLGRNYIEKSDYPSSDKEWDLHWMAFAETIAKTAECFSRKIGAVLVRHNKLLAVGKNGPPRGIPLCNTRVEGPSWPPGCPRKKLGYKSGEGLDLCIAAHAERDALINAARRGVSTKDSTLYCYCGPPCKDCMVEIINAGVVEVVYKDGGGTGNFGEYYDLLSKYLVENSSILVRGINFDKDRRGCQWVVERNPKQEGTKQKLDT